jgi:hypothetical protein
MSKGDGFKDDKAREFHNTFLLSQQLTSIAQVCVGSFQDHIIVALEEASATIQKQSLDNANLAIELEKCHLAIQAINDSGLELGEKESALIKSIKLPDPF